VGRGVIVGAIGCYGDLGCRREVVVELVIVKVVIVANIRSARDYGRPRK